ncbi:hypothetical protein [Actinoplanes solisilvae]|uniref:hypothetical protein n=1 Tax=Actinoplanes solisilvae TaxID=2486853 RepID=UPI000FD7A825|nr:hypothetical protein [Actinoplanes solisilvae]
MTTQAGAVEATAITGDRITVQTKAGATELDFAEPPAAVVTETELGAVRLRVPPGVAYAVSVGTDVGGSEIKVDQDAASKHRIDVRTRVGAVKIEHLR